MTINIYLLRESFREVEDEAKNLAKDFYQQMFKSYPESKHLFDRTEIPFQEIELDQAFGHILKIFENNEEIKDYLWSSGIRHTTYGIEGKHYPMFKECMMTCLSNLFKEKWNAQLDAEWEGLIDFILEHMRRGAKEVRPEIMG
jgi:hemoglobin-like flavoprotein